MNRRCRRLVITAVSVAGILAAGTAYAISDCYFAGVNFSDGAVACQSGSQYRCSDGDWAALDLPCAAPPPSPTIANPADCSCTGAELANCERMSQACCISLDGGKCTKSCCPTR